MKKVKNADLHIHSNYSDAQNSIEEILNYVENETDLDFIAITDHNTIKGAFLAEKISLSQKMRIRVIIGEEISCQEGHLVGLFLQKEIPGNLPASHVLKLIKDQNGIAVASHPFVKTPLKDQDGNEAGGLGLETILIEKNDINALETVNGNLIMKYKENRKADYINHNFIFKSSVGGSDAHILSSIGKSYTIFTGDTKEDLKNAILQGKTQTAEKKWNFISVIKYTLFIYPEIFKAAYQIIKIKVNEKFKKMVKFYSSYFNNNVSIVVVDLIQKPFYYKGKTRNS